MKKSFKRIWTVSVLCLVLAFVTMLTGCGLDGSNYISEEAPGSIREDYEDASADMGNDILGGSYNGKEENEISVNEGRKIIETVGLTMETKDFESLISQIEAEVKVAGGYIETSNISGNGYSENNDSANHSRPSRRNAYMKIRIPASVDDKFNDFIYENANVTRREVDTEDITLKYVDIESRIKSYETEKEALENLLAQATSVNDIITIQDRLTEVIYNIEGAKSQLRTYDNLVDYTTFNLNINEVETITPVEEQTVWQEIGTNLKNNFGGVLYFFERLFVIVISCIPQLIVIGIIAVVVVVIVKVSSKKKKKKREARERERKE